MVSSREAARYGAAAPRDGGRAAELATLAALCPSDVAADREFLGHVLNVHGLEVGDPVEGQDRPWYMISNIYPLHCLCCNSSRFRLAPRLRRDRCSA